VTARRTDAQDGFTLVEVLISIVLLAMLGTMIAGGLRIVGRGWNDAERQSANSDDMFLLQNLFRRTIARTAPAYASPNPRDTTIAFAGDATTLSLMAPQPGTNFAGPWINERFFVASNGASRALFVALPRDTAPNPVVLLDHVANIRFAYYGSTGAGGAPAWQDSWTGQARLPDLIRVAIVRDNPKLRAWPDLVVGTRVTANAGCIYSAYANGCRRAR
jgi:general secretion pathway protein J